MKSKKTIHSNKIRFYEKITSNNKYGGHKARRLRALNGTFGPAGPCKTYDATERLLWAKANGY